MYVLVNIWMHRKVAGVRSEVCQMCNILLQLTNLCMKPKLQQTYSELVTKVAAPLVPSALFAYKHEKGWPVKLQTRPAVKAIVSTMTCGHCHQYCSCSGGLSAGLALYSAACASGREPGPFEKSKEDVANAWEYAWSHQRLGAKVQHPSPWPLPSKSPVNLSSTKITCVQQGSQGYLEYSEMGVAV